MAHMTSGLAGLFSQVRIEGVKIMLCYCHTALSPWLAWGQTAPEQCTCTGGLIFVSLLTPIKYFSKRSFPEKESSWFVPLFS